MILLKDLEKSDKYIVGLAALCALMLFSWLTYDILFLNPLLEGQVEIGKIYEVQNKVKRKFNRSLVWYVAEQNETVYENDWIFTGSVSIAKIKLDSGGEVVIEPDSLIILSRKNGVLQLDLKHGRLLADVDSSEIRIQVTKNGETQVVDTSQGAVSISDGVEPLTLDNDADGKDDLTLSELADRRNFKAKKGFSELDENGLSYKVDNKVQAELFEGDKAQVDLQWIDPFGRWQNYEVEHSNDPNFNNILGRNKGSKPNFAFATDTTGTYYWRVRGLDANGTPSSWSKTLEAQVDIEYKELGEPLKLVKDSFELRLDYKKLDDIGPDGLYTFAEDENLNISWQANNKAVSYKVQTSDREDFSNILTEKITDANNLTLNEAKLGESYFRVIPENANGVAIASAANGKVWTYLPAPKESSLKTIDKDTYQLMKWAPVPHAKGYKVTYKTDKKGKTQTRYVKNNKLRVENQTGFLQWQVRVADPETKKIMSANSDTVDWYNAAKRLASLHGTGQAGLLYPKIIKPAARKTFISLDNAPLFMVMKWTYGSEAKAYEVEISKKPDMSKIVYRKTVDDKKRAVINERFKPGVYFMRVRALQEDVTQEAWSKVEAFRVKNRPSS